MSPTGLTRDAGWQVGVSRTFPVPVERAWATLTGGEGLAAWLGEGAALPAAPGEGYRLPDGTVGELRSLRPRDRVRLTWQPPGRPGPTTVQVALRATPTGTRVAFHQERMADAAEREAQRAHWAAALDRLAPLLGA